MTPSTMVRRHRPASPLRRIAAFVATTAVVVAACGSTASPSPAVSQIPTSGVTRTGPTATPPTSVLSGSPAASAPPGTSAPSPLVGSSARPTASSAPSASPASSALSASPAAASPTSESCGGALNARPTPTPPPATTPAAGATPPSIALQEVTTGLSAPLDVVTPRDGTNRLFIVEQGGLVRILANGSLLDEPFLDVRDLTHPGGEQGLLGLAFHPNYACDGRFYINYTDTNGDTVVAEYRVSADDPNRADPQPLARLLQIKQPFPNHNGGDLVFGPDGDLYVGMGDGGSEGDPQGNGQRLDTDLGKLLRIAVDGRPAGGPPAIPPDNCHGCPDAPLPEIDAYGLRNPWRFSFDRATGDLWIGDVGQDTFEEVDHVAASAISGTNFGWSVMEANACYHPSSGCDQSGITLPVAQYDHNSGDCSIAGGFVYRGTAIPALDGWYLFGDYCSGRIRALSSGGGDPSIVLETHGSIVSFGEDDGGELYVADIAKGTVSKVVRGPG
jgi:glucose/arabinose dehydrogenase